MRAASPLSTTTRSAIHRPREAANVRGMVPTTPDPCRSRIDVDRVASNIATGQHGLVTRAQLLAAGATSRRIQGRVESGRLRPLHRGVYLVGSVAPSLAVPLSACLACGPDAVVSHRSAAALWKLVPPVSGDDTVDVTVRGGNRRRPGVRVHRSRTLRRSERTLLDGVPVTKPTRTLLDLAVAAPARTIERAVAEALARGLTTEARLAECLKRHRGRPGSAGLGTVLDLGPPDLTRSEAEERFLALVRRADMPRPRVNARIGPYEVDFHWPVARLVVEVDGFGPHHSRRAFERDRRRDAYLVAQGFSVIRTTWQQMEEKSEELAFRLGQALAMRG